MLTLPPLNTMLWLSSVITVPQSPLESELLILIHDETKIRERKMTKTVNIKIP